MKIAVTGSHGFIGQHYVSRAAQDSEVVAYDKINGHNLTVSADAMSDCDAVVHLAATNGTKLFYKKPTDILINDTTATFNVVKRYLGSNTKIVFASSCEIFNSAIDKQIYPIPTDELVPVMFDYISNPRWSYSLPKAVGENLITNCGNPWLVIRYFNIYGPGQRDHFVDEFVKRAATGEYYINGNDTRSFCYIDDAVEMTHSLVKNYHGLTVNVGQNKEYRISEVAEIILDIMGIDPKKLTVNLGVPGSAKRRCPDTTLVKNLTGFTNYTTIKDGLKKTVESIL